MKKLLIILALSINIIISHAQQINGSTIKQQTYKTVSGVVDKVNKSNKILNQDEIITASKIGVGIPSSEIPKDYKVAIAGGLIVEDVLIELKETWPDYVFGKEYSLLPLKEVENYIMRNGHLKNIPSAQKVANEGINVGEMNVKLLEKIEELTLYIIQQEKRIEKLEVNQKK